MAATPNVPVRPVRLIARDSSIGAQEDFSPVGFIDPTRTTVQGGWGQPGGNLVLGPSAQVKVGVVEAVGYTAFAWFVPGIAAGAGTYELKLGVTDPRQPTVDVGLQPYLLNPAFIGSNSDNLVTWGNNAPSVAVGITSGQVGVVWPFFSLYIVAGVGGCTISGFGLIVSTRP